MVPQAPPANVTAKLLAACLSLAVGGLAVVLVVLLARDVLAA
jgi:hypothetical protein